MTDARDRGRADRIAARDADATLATRYTRYQTMGLSESDADQLTRSREFADFYDDALAETLTLARAKRVGL